MFDCNNYKYITEIVQLKGLRAILDYDFMLSFIEEEQNCYYVYLHCSTQYPL